MHIVHFTSAHPWDDIRILHKMCVEAVRQGHQVSLVAVDPEAKQDRKFDFKGVEVHLLARRAGPGRLRRATKVAWRVTRYAVALKPDVLQFHDPELIPHAALVVPGRIPLIFDAHEDFVAQLEGKAWVKAGLKKRLLRAAMAGLRRLIAWRATHILAATDGVRAAYPSHKSRVVRNLPILAEFDSQARLPLEQRGPEACYVGAISRARGIVELVEALALSPATEVLHLAGRFETKELEASLRAMPGWAKLRYHGLVGRAEIAEILGRSRAGLVTLHATPNHLHAIPIKMLEYLCAGIVSIASDFEYWHGFVEQGRTALFVDPQDPQAIAAALEQVMAQPAAFEAAMTPEARRRFAWEEEALVLEAVYAACHQSRRGHSSPQTGSQD